MPRTQPAPGPVPRTGRLVLAALAGAAIGVLGGMIGLGGAELRLPLLIGVFGFLALQAVIVNKALSLVVVLTAIPARLVAVPPADLADHWEVVANLLGGSLFGAYLGAVWATRLPASALHRVLAALLLLIAGLLLATHLGTVPSLTVRGEVQVVLGLLAGLGIGLVAAVMGIAGGELLIPTITLLYAVDVKLAGSLSLLVSLPTMLVAFARYSRDDSFRVLHANGRFVLVMAVGSATGTVVGGLLLGVVPEAVLVPVLAGLLVLSAWKVAQHPRST